MKAILASIAVLVAAPLAAEPTPEQAPEPTSAQAEAIAAVDAFFTALRSDDKTALAREMDSAGTIYIHDRRDPAGPEVTIVPVAAHLARWAETPPGLDERMVYKTVLVTGDMAQVWGPYRFIAGGKTTHCGINNMSLVKREGRWRVANTSFTMELPERCAALGAPEAPAQ
jgi:hypothetical protein